MLMRKLQLSSPGAPEATCRAQPHRVLVTGGAGYLGSVLVRRLLARNLEVTVLDSLLFGDWPLAPLRTHPGFHLIRGDIRDLRSVAIALQGCDTVIHLAAIVRDHACASSPDVATEVNSAATLNLVHLCRAKGVRQFLLASSGSVYGATDEVVDETSTPHPVSHYAQTKIDAERAVLSAAADGFHPTVLRLGTLFGVSPRPRFDLLVNLLTKQAASIGRITIYNGGQWRPFLHVADAARAFERCIDAPPTLVSREIFNVGDDLLNLQLSEISAKIAAVFPRLVTEHKDNTDPRSYRASFQKIRTRLGFHCTHSVEYGIRELLKVLPPTGETPPLAPAVPPVATAAGLHRAMPRCTCE
jgi:nucleoside-diphosphate-sugar epimerase